MLSALVFSTLLSICVGAYINPGLSAEALNARSNQAKLMKSYMNESIDPCIDFYEYACGNWKNIYPIPDDQDNFDIHRVRALSETEEWKKLLENSAENQDGGDAIKKAKDFYASCMDVKRIEDRGTRPLLDFLNSIGGWPAIDENWTGNDHDWIEFYAEMKMLGEEKLFQAGVGKNIFDVTKSSLYVLYPAMTLGTRHIYYSETRELSAYRTLISDTLRAFNVRKDRINAEVNDIVNFEIELAKIVLDLSEYQNDVDSYSVMTIGDIERRFTSINWSRYNKLVFTESLSSSDQIIGSEKFLSSLNSLIKNTSKRTMFNFLGWHLVSDLALYVGPKFEIIRHNYYATINGLKADQSRVEKCIENAQKYFENAVGSVFAQKHFTQKAREDAKILLNVVKETLEEYIEKAQWVDRNTKNIAKLKLKKINMQVGYPDFILDSKKLNDYYKRVNIKRTDYFENMLSILTNKLENNGWPLNFLAPNAIYDNPSQTMYITAMMFKPPSYHKDFPKFMNFAGIGAITAHEVTHAIDSNGAVYDENGNANEWFSKPSQALYKMREECFIERYSNFTMNGIPLNGAQVVVEVVADDVGIKVGFQSYEKWVRDNRHSPEINNEQLDGFSHLSKEQMFFLNYGQFYCATIRPEAMFHLFKKDNHATQKFRVNGVLSNLRIFSETFKCSEDSPMNPTTKCALW